VVKPLVSDRMLDFVSRVEIHTKLGVSFWAMCQLSGCPDTVGACVRACVHNPVREGSEWVCVLPYTGLVGWSLAGTSS